MKWLNGNKTYIGMTLMGIVGLLWAAGIIEDDVAKYAETLIVTFTGFAFRHAISKLEK